MDDLGTLNDLALGFILCYRSNMDDLGTLNDLAPLLGVSRQALDQALARAGDDRPLPALNAGRTKFYRRSDVQAWWAVHTERAWKERRRQGERKSIQINVRIGPADLDRLDRFRDAGETRSAAAHRALVAALASPHFLVQV